MKDNVIIQAVMDDGVPMMFSVLEKEGIDTSKCFICEVPIVATEREPRYISETLSRWWARVKGGIRSSTSGTSVRSIIEELPVMVFHAL